MLPKYTSIGNGYDGVQQSSEALAPQTVNRARTFLQTGKSSGVMHAAQFSKTACAGAMCFIARDT